MSVLEIKKQLVTMKIHLDQLDNWTHQISNMIYEVEEKLMDIESVKIDESLFYKKYSTDVNMEFFKDAASGI